DETVAEDAFLEFARSNNADIGQVARKLDADKLRKLLQNPKTSPAHLGLFAFMLGACGKESDAPLLRKLIDQPDERTKESLDGLLAGYIQMDKKHGWELTGKIMADPKQQFKQRFAAIRTMRFHYGWQPAETKAQVLRWYNVLLDDGQISDMPIDDLR